MGFYDGLGVREINTNNIDLALKMFDRERFRRVELKDDDLLKQLYFREVISLSAEKKILLENELNKNNGKEYINRFRKKLLESGDVLGCRVRIEVELQELICNSGVIIPPASINGKDVDIILEHVYGYHDFVVEELDNQYYNIGDIEFIKINNEELSGEFLGFKIEKKINKGEFLLLRKKENKR